MLPLFALTLFVSAALLFLVQPLIGKMILPRLGGTPAVWNTCMVFFQAVLLVGYTYTHTVSTWQSRRRQVLMQLVILLLPFLGFLPFTLGAWEPPAEANPSLHVLWLLLGMVGLPFFVVSTSAPLLQRWFSGTNHPSAKDPYFLYGASNLGSMLALLAYPVLVEPFFPVATQAWIWTAGYALLVALVVACAGAIWQGGPSPEVARDAAPSASLPAAGTEAITAKPRRGFSFATAKASVGDEPRAAGPVGRPITTARRLRWVALAAAPSSLMLGTTTYLTTDIAAIPFFWVVPLALYLLTFILVFARWPMMWSETPHDGVLYAQPLCLMLLAAAIVTNLNIGVLGLFLLHSLGFFATALMCHGELARDRPEPRHLTEFYLWLSVGGVAGGLFNALAAPLFFRTGNIEYPAAMVLACMLRPRLFGRETLIPGDTSALETTRLGRILDFALPAGLGVIAFFAAKYGAAFKQPGLFLLVPCVAVMALFFRPLRFGLAVGCLFLASSIYESTESTLLYQDRGFFGFVKVRRDVVGYIDNQGRTTREEIYHTLVHGSINHGMQNMDPARRREPITYFHPTSGIGQIFEQMKWSDARLPASLAAMGPCPLASLVNLKSEPPYAVVGLGIGTLAAHARPLQNLDFYEIDPLIRRLSVPEEGDELLFYYVQDAAQREAQVRILMGDGRLVMEREAPDSYYHVLVLDAFSSDAIPVHLLTAEAIDIYLKKLVPGGVLIFNATNRYVDIRPVLADLAASRNMDCYFFSNPGEEVQTPNRYPSDWIVLQRRAFHWEETKERPIPDSGSPPLRTRLPTGEGGWRVLQPPGDPLWTDGYSNLLRVVIW